MARIRTIKPEFFTSEDIVGLSPLARLLYIATWCEADKEGRLHWKPKTLKMRYLPGDACDVASLCDELISAGLIRLYGDGLAHIPRFSAHQHVNPRETSSSLPEPPGHKDEGPRKVGKNLREEVFSRDGYKCVRCGSDDRIQVDHILPQSCGGPHLIENLRTFCRSCNAGRPVQGHALVEDLARDGFTIESLRIKFGIDASTPDRDTQGGREGKGREDIKAPQPPEGAAFELSSSTKQRVAAKASITLATYLADCESQGAEAIPETDAVWTSAEAAGLPREFIPLAWWAFQGRYLGGKTRQASGAGWVQKFRNAVRENWFKLWWINGETYQLTTTGMQVKREMEASA